MSCAHCLRGEAQDVDIDLTYIDDLLDQTELIGKLWFYGGEPTLNLGAIEYTLDGMICRKIPLLNLKIYTNGLIYSDRFIRILKKYRQLIDVSCSAGLKNYKNEPERIWIGISLDRYHEHHDACLTNYEKYKSALDGYAAVTKVMHGNSPGATGRGKNLSKVVIPNEQFELNRQYGLRKKIEVLDANHKPACYFCNEYTLCHPQQKIVCCAVCVDEFGMLSCVESGGCEYDIDDISPKICHVSQPIWDEILAYNRTRIPCVIAQEQMRKEFAERGYKPLPQRDDSVDEAPGTIGDRISKIEDPNTPYFQRVLLAVEQFKPNYRRRVNSKTIFNYLAHHDYNETWRSKEIETLKSECAVIDKELEQTRAELAEIEKRKAESNG